MKKTSKIMSKLLSFILTAAMAATCMPAPVYALDAGPEEELISLSASESGEALICDEAVTDDIGEIVNGDLSAYGDDLITYEGEPIAHEEDEDIEVSYPEFSADRFAADNAGGDYMDSGQTGVTKRSMKEIAESMPVWGMSDKLYASDPNTSSSGYKTAVLTDEAYSYVQKYINYYRGVAGLSSISFTDDLNNSAAWGALVNAMNGVLDHYPTKPEGMSDEDYQKGADATGSSNLSYSGGYKESEVLKVAIDGQMADESVTILPALVTGDGL